MSVADQAREAVEDKMPQEWRFHYEGADEWHIIKRLSAEVVRLHTVLAELADRLEDRADLQEKGILPNAPGLAYVKRDAAARIRAALGGDDV